MTEERTYYHIKFSSSGQKNETSISVTDLPVQLEGFREVMKVNLVHAEHPDGSGVKETEVQTAQVNFDKVLYITEFEREVQTE